MCLLMASYRSRVIVSTGAVTTKFGSRILTLK